ncbi:MAG: hypothetical protein HYX87_07615 [Chloroflexi bacterium]|nr:hypothetical protein [Chloroflexota bacterium]
MGTVDIFLLVIRWLHVLAAAALVGGGIFYVLGLRLAGAKVLAQGDADRSRQVKSERSKLAGGFLAIIVASGLVLGLDRLSRPEVNGVYLALLVLKLLLAGSTLSLVRRLAWRPGAEGRAHLPGRWGSMTVSNLMLALGAATFLVSVFLRAVFEVALRQG